MSVTLVVHTPTAASTRLAHAVVDRLCDARWLGSSRRSRLRAAVTGESLLPAVRVPETGIAPAAVERARALIHERVEAVTRLVERVTDDDAPAGVTAQRIGPAMRITIGSAAFAAPVEDLAAWGTGELLSRAWVVEGGATVPDDRTGGW